MDLLAITVFCGAVVLGSYVQAATGFAMALVVLAVVTAGRVLDVAALAAVISLLALVNVVLALRGEWAARDQRGWLLLCLGQVPAIGLGIWLLQLLAAQALMLLEAILGIFVVVGSISMLLRPEPNMRISPAWAWVTSGALAGLLGGLFAASGPVMGWFGYRQPLPVRTIRATLLACFAVTTATRTLIVGAQGGLTPAVWSYFLAGVPLVALGTWVGRRWAPRSEQSLRRLASTVLLLLGLWILARSSAALFV